MSEYLLDSNVLIRYLRKRYQVRAFLDQWARDDQVSISVVTRSEILAGMRPEQETRTLLLLDSLGNRPVTSEIADRAGRWIYQYARRGVQLAFPDALIAATAAVHDLVLVTSNGKHFPMPEVHLHLLEP